MVFSAVFAHSAAVGGDADGFNTEDWDTVGPPVQCIYISL